VLLLYVNEQGDRAQSDGQREQTCCLSGGIGQIVSRDGTRDDCMTVWRNAGLTTTREAHISCGGRMFVIAQYLFLSPVIRRFTRHITPHGL